MKFVNCPLPHDAELYRSNSVSSKGPDVIFSLICQDKFNQLSVASTEIRQFGTSLNYTVPTNVRFIYPSQAEWVSGYRYDYCLFAARNAAATEWPFSAFILILNFKTF